MMPVLEIVGNLLLFGLVFGMSATVDTNCMKQQIKNRMAIFMGVFCQFVLLPFFGFAVVNLLKLDAAVGITLLVVTSSPGGSYSNWWCSLFNADLALSVTMTAVSTILSVVMLPVNLLIYAKFSYDADVTQSIDFMSVFVALGIVIVAITLGLFVSYQCHSYKFNMIANKIGNFAGLFLILFSALMASGGGGNGDEAGSNVWNNHWTFYVAITAPCLMGLITSALLTSVLDLRRPERMSVSIECCYQNTGIATSMALTMFQGNDLNQAMGVPFLYGIIEAVLIGLFCVICWKGGWSKAPADAPIWNVISVSYEVLETEIIDTDIDQIEVSISRDEETAGTNTKPQDEHDGNILMTYFCMADGEQQQTEDGDKNIERRKRMTASKKAPSGLIDVSMLKSTKDNNERLKLAAASRRRASILTMSTLQPTIQERPEEK